MRRLTANKEELEFSGSALPPQSRHWLRGSHSGSKYSSRSCQQAMSTLTWYKLFWMSRTSLGNSCINCWAMTSSSWMIAKCRILWGQQRKTTRFIQHACKNLQPYFIWHWAIKTPQKPAGLSNKRFNKKILPHNSSHYILRDLTDILSNACSAEKMYLTYKLRSCVKSALRVHQCDLHLEERETN